MGRAWPLDMLTQTNAARRNIRYERQIALTQVLTESVANDRRTSSLWPGSWASALCRGGLSAPVS